MNKVQSFFLVLSVISMTASATTWKLVFEDNFEGTTINTTNWNVYNMTTHGPTELELYMADDVYMQDGKLILRTRCRSISHGNTLYNFTSGMVDSINKVYFTYGRFEVRAQLPNNVMAAGIWPAHWLMPQPSTSVPPNVCWPVGGEIDIMERVGGAYNNSVLADYHYGTLCNKDEWTSKNRGYYPVRVEGEYHVYSVEWSNNSLTWYVDGIQYYSNTMGKEVPFIPSDPFYIILNTAIEPNYGKNISNLPVYHAIDYVRIYQAVA